MISGVDTSQDEYLREDLLEIYKDPINVGHIDNPTVSVFDRNPMCGDVITLEIKISGDNGNEVLEDIKYSGDACAVSIISSSLVTEELIGKTLEEAKNLTKEDVLELIGVELTTSRVKCATLVLNALHKAIQKYEQK